MAYLALYRKYRPTDFSSVVGQNEIKKILSNAISKDNISHAYLFSGPRGTGKTTTAKILAKMVNCEHLKDGEPCNECESCRNLFNSNDVIEIDAASNNGVDEIRDLREKATLVPSICRYKVYIIDEVHMLTTQAFNALLKILEEPPKHVIFILATTEYHKIPLTITSRCQKFQFNKLEIEDIFKRLREIADLEKINIEDEALYEIAKISDGGMRDSINFLDQIRSFTNDKITISDVYEVCGNISSEDIYKLFVDLAERKAENITLFFEKMNENGKNYNKFFEDVVCFLKDVVLYQENVNISLIKSKVEYVKEIAKLYSESDIFNIIDSINALMDKLRYVSRQTVVVIANFLLIMNNLNKKNDDIVDSKKKIEKKNDEDKYDLAFNFTNSDKKNDSKLTSENLQQEVPSHNDLIEENKENAFINKDIIINNAFAVASKMVKQNLQDRFSKIEEYLTDKRFASAVSLFVDTDLEVAGEGYIIFTGKYDAIVDNISRNLLICKEFINNLFDDKYNFIVITKDEWNKYREEYIKNIKSGKKYELKEFEQQNKIIDNTVVENEPTVVDRLFDIVGEDIIEFK